MIRVCYSNRLEALTGALCEALPEVGRPEEAPDDPCAPFAHLFQVPWLIVPSRPMKLYLDLAIARRRGISGNRETLSMAGALARLCAEGLPDVVLIERGHIVGELLAVLGGHDQGAHETWAPIHAYLQAAGSAPAVIDRRRVEVARALGSLFHDWTLDRPALMAAWRTGQAHPVNATPLERAERALWDILFGPDGRFSRRGAAENRRYLTLDSVLASGLDDAWKPPGALHVFGLATLPAGLPRALHRLGSRTSVNIYALNPCREFWEDLDTGRRVPTPATRAARKGRSRPSGPGQRAADLRQLELVGLVAPVPVALPVSLDASAAPAAPADTAGAESGLDQENPALRLWGSAVRETIAALNQLGDGDFEDRFVDPAGGDDDPSRITLLRRVQRDLLTRAPSQPRARERALPPDESVAIIGAPDPRRELESIAAEIWAMIRADDGGPRAPGGTGPPPLGFSDIAVLIAGAEQPYLSLLPAVFREATDLPHALCDQPLATSSHMADAVLALLALPQTSLSRRDVLDVLTHPNIRARFPDASPQVWLELCDALAIAHGADRAALDDTYIDRDAFNWDQGIKRLTLGLFARGPRSGVDDPVDLPGPAGPAPYLPAEVDADLRPDANALALLTRSLLADAAFAKRADLTLTEWMRFVRALMTSYVVPLTADDEAARLRLFTVLDRIAAQAPPNLRVALDIARDLVGEGLNDLRGSRGQMLGAGVAVGTLESLRALPFRVVFVAGLGGGRFPTADRPSPLDLGGDGFTPKTHLASERDRALFLEAWLSARDRLILSYVDRDPLTGETREPSPVVLELVEILRRSYLPEATPAPFRHVPLQRDEDPATCAAFPPAAAEARARTVGASLRAQIPGVEACDPDTLAKAFSPAATRTLAPLLRTIEAPVLGTGAGTRDVVSAPSFSARPARRVLHLSDLRRFLECPLQGSARVFLGLRDLPDDADARDTTDEPFDVPRSIERSLLGDVFASAWQGSAPPDAAALAALYDVLVGRHRAGRFLPAGLFRNSVRRRHLQILDQWAQAVTTGPGAPCGPARRVCFGRPLPSAPPADRRPAIRLVIDREQEGPVEIELHGTTEPQVAWGAGPGQLGPSGSSGSLVLATSPSDRDKNDKDSLRAFLDHVALAASAAAAGPADPFVAAICRPTKTTTPDLTSVAFGPLDATEARAYLGRLARAVLFQVHSYLFPCEAVFHARGGELSLVDSIHQIRTDKFYREHSSSRFGPVPDPFDYPVPTREDADRMRDERFGLFLSLRKDAPVRAGRGKS